MNEREEAIELREDLEVLTSVMQTVINKLDQFIDGEITEDEYKEWIENNEGMFDEVAI